MSKLIFTDFDLTLINRNLERDFLIYLFRKDSKNRIRILMNALQHTWIKYVKKLTGQRNNLKYYYKGLSVSYIEKNLSNFIRDKSHMFLWNESILKMINAEKDILVILTRCPKFICKKFCELNFTKIKWKLYGSLLSVNDNEFTGGVKLKLNNKIKKIICEYEKLNSFAPSLLTTGYGDSIDDIDFLETVDKSYGLTKEICNSNSNIIYLKPKWTNVCSL